MDPVLVMTKAGVFYDSRYLAGGASVVSCPQYLAAV